MAITPEELGRNGELLGDPIDKATRSVDGVLEDCHSHVTDEVTEMGQLPKTACLCLVTITASVFFILPAAFGQSQTTDKAASFPADSVFAEVDKIFAQWDKPDSPGCALGVIKDGQLIYKRGYGMANLDYNIPISPESVFDIASISKQFTAMSILLLSKQGKLSLDDEIQEYLPEIPRYESPVTIRHLIHHTSGLREGFLLAQLLGMDSEKVHLTGDDILALLALQKEPSNKAGEEGGYSNTGYLLLGFIVKRVSGTSLREYAEENIFKPLGMQNTHFHDDHTMVIKNRVTGYLTEYGGRYSVAIGIDRGEDLGNAGIFTTVEDLFLWDQNFDNNKLGGGPDLIKDFLSGSVLNNGEIGTYAFGTGFDEYKGLKRNGHGGVGWGFNLEMERYPGQNFSVYCLCNLDTINPRRLANQVADVFLADQFEQDEDAVEEAVEEAPVIVSVPEKELAALTGFYFEPIRSNIRRIVLKDGKLMSEFNFNGRESELLPLGQNRFRMAGAPYEIVFTRPVTDGPLQATLVSLRSGVGYPYDAVEVLNSVQLAEYTGEYRSDELPGATYSLSIKDGEIRLIARNATTLISSERGLTFWWTLPDKSEAANGNLLTPVSADVAVFFISGSRSSLRFMRNQQNAVSGFALSVGSVKNIRFEKL